jgi:competence protein ComEA
MQAAQGVTGKRKFALAALLTFLLFAAFLATAQRARADTGSPDPNTAGEVAAPPSQDPSIPQQTADQSTPQPTTDQQSTTDQAANAAATAVQPQQSNVVIIIRINSPGDDVVTQTNVVSVVADADNQSSTSQNSGLPAPSPDGADTGTGSSDAPGADGQTTEGQAAPMPGAAPARPAPAQAQAAAAPTAVEQPVVQPTQAEPAGPAQPQALAVLASAASSTANRAAPETQKGSPTMSATPLRRGGARGRSDASASRTPAEAQMAGIAAGPTPKVRAGGDATSTRLHARNTTTIAAKGAPDSWLNRARLAPPVQSAESGAGLGANLGLTTLTALLVGLVACSVLTWFSARGSPWRRAGG